MKFRAKLTKGAVQEPPTRSTPRKPASRAARMLALAYFIERNIDTGDLQDYAHAARLLGVSRARVSQIARLVTLPVAVQEDVLLGRVDGGERGLSVSCP